MNKNEIKDKIQRNGLNVWFRNGCKGTLEYATGVGKTRCGVLAVQHFVDENPDLKVLILTPRENIRDVVWKDEFTKWKAMKAFGNVEMICIQTAHKRVGQQYDLVIADEIHNYLSPKYLQFFKKNICRRVLGLSASIDGDKKKDIRFFAPIVDSIDIFKAAELGLVSPFKIYNLAIDLTPKERNEYARKSDNFTKLFHVFDNDINEMFRCQNGEYFKSYCKRNGIDYEESKRVPFICMNGMQGRKKILYDCQNKLKQTVELCKMMSDKKGIIFTETIPFAEDISDAIGDECTVFHSKMKKKEKQVAMTKLNDGRTKVTRIASPRSLNEGMNIPKLSFAVIAAGNSKPKDTIQRIGRAVRWEPDKETIIVRLYVKNSQEEKWLKYAQGDYEAVFVNSIEEIALKEGYVEA